MRLNGKGRERSEWGMDHKEQIQHFADELDRLVERFRSEYDLTYAATVGALMMKAHLLMAEAADREDEA